MSANEVDDACEDAESNRQRAVDTASSKGRSSDAGVMCREIQRRREVAGLSQAELANLVGYSREYVSRAERPAKGLPSPGLVAGIDDALQAGGALVRLRASLQKQRETRRTAMIVPKRHAPGAAAPSRCVDRVGGSSPNGVDEEIEVAAEDAARFVREAGRGVSAELVDQLVADLRRLAVAYLRRAPFELFRPLASLRTEVFGILDRHPPLQFARDLYGVAGRVSALLAHASSDLGHPDAAEVHARSALLCADLAGDRALSSYTRWVQSNVAYWAGDYAGAAQAARAGREAALDADDILRLTSQEARACAAQGDHAGTDAALSAMYQVRGSGTNGDRALSTVGVFVFGEGKAAYYASEARLALGGSANVRLAVSDARDAVTLLATSAERPASRELEAAARLDLADALLTDNDLESAAHEIDVVLDLPPESRTVPVIARISRIDSQLAGSFAAVERANDLRERAALFNAYPAARELPALTPAGHIDSGNPDGGER